MRAGLTKGAMALALLAAAGCRGHGAEAPRPQVPVAVEVTNHNRLDVNVYVTRAGNRSRVGTVVAGNTRRFLLRHMAWEGLQRLEFDVWRIGGEGLVRLPEVSVAPGQEVRIRIQDLASTSDISLVDVEDNAVQPKRLP